MKRTSLRRKTSLKRKTPLRARARAGTSKKVKAKHRPVKTIKRDLTTVFNRFIRLRAASTHPGLHVQCVTCDKWFKFSAIEAGHYIHDNNLTRYDERNVHPQCNRCNCHKSGNIPSYAVYLSKRYGPDILVEFDRKSRQMKRFSATELEIMLKDYRAKLAILERKCGV